MSILYTGFTALIIGMGIVFFALALIACVILIMGRIGSGKKGTERGTTPVNQAHLSDSSQTEIVTSNNTQSLETVAAITAAVAACLNVRAEQVIIKSIKKSTERMSSPWNLAARHENQRREY